MKWYNMVLRKLEGKPCNQVPGVAGPAAVPGVRTEESKPKLQDRLTYYTAHSQLHFINSGP